MAESGASSEIEPERLIGERIAGRFVVERLIGHGQLSTAFRAHDDRLHRRVTVKLFHPRHRDDIHVVESQLAAAKAVARLSHEHVAIVIDRGEHEGMPLIVLEHVRGENLQERIDRYAPLAVGEVVGYGLQVARALAYAHGHGVVHGNLRPANVLLTEEREVKLVDFGGGSYVAKLVGDPYAAPELRELDADAPAEPGDDMYALGALLFVALTEQAPVAGLDASELQLLRPDVSPRLATVVTRALAADPADRQESMRELAAELASVREASSTSVQAQGEPAGFAAGQDTRAFSIDELDEHGLPEREATAPQGRPRRARRARREQGRVRTPRETRARILAWSMVLAPLAALVIFGLMIAGEHSEEQVAAPAKQGAGPTTAATIVSAASFDPEGDGAEHEDKVGNAFDGDLDTTWQTEGYSTNDFNRGQKPGVGLRLELEEPRDVRDVVIQTGLPGWVVEVRAAEQPGGELDDWRTVSKATAVESGVRIPVDLDGEDTRHVLLWITRLALDVDDTDWARARIGEVRVMVTDEGGSVSDTRE